MNYKLIMFHNPILVSDEGSDIGDWTLFPNTINGIVENFDGCRRKKAEYRYSSNGVYNFKVIAGIEGLPKLDLSFIADEIGWVDVDDIIKKVFYKEDGINFKRSTIGADDWIEGLKFGIKEAQSLNDKKFSKEEVVKLMTWSANMAAGKIDSDKGYSDILYEIELKTKSLPKHKEYSVKVDMEDVGNKGKVYVCSSKSDWQPKITSNIIKILRVIN